MKTARLVRFVGFNLLWILTAFLAKTNYVNFLVLIFVGLLLWDLRRVSARQKIVSVLILLVGIAFDFLAAHLGVIRFYGMNEVLFPMWLVALWILFSWLAPFLIQQFANQRLLLAGLSAVFGPLSYYSGLSFGIVEMPTRIFFLVYGIFWGLFIYAVHFLTDSKREVASGN